MDGFKLTPKPIGFTEYSKADEICQEVFGVEFFNWLSFWERHHLNRKHKLNLNEKDDFYERSEIQIVKTIKL